MTESLSFTKYLIQISLDEATIPTVWGKRLVNVASEDEESTENVENQEDEFEADSEVDAELDLGDDLGMSDLEDEDLEDEDLEDDDPNKQGVIRKVTSAHLVYKRKDEEGTYEELWIYKLNGEFKDELEIRRDILAGTDIPQNKMKSEDGAQSYQLWTSGNVQWLNITGLPN